MFRILFTFCALVLCLTLPSGLPASEPGMDHPLVSRMPGYVISEYQSGFGKKIFPVPTAEEDVYEDKGVEGQRTWITYETPGDRPHATELEIVRNYAVALKRLGGLPLFETNNQTNYKLSIQDKEMWVQAYAYNDGEIYELTIIEAGEADQVVKAGNLSAALDRDGHVAVYIRFDSGKAYVKAESRRAIEEIAALMQSRPELRLRVEGHTDDVGDAKANLVLSEERAKAVVNVLSFLGADTARMEPVGLGESSPIADNLSEGGRAKNRRVELVKR